MRVRVWPRLMGIDLIETDVTIPTDEEIKKHPEYNQGTENLNSCKIRGGGGYIFDWRIYGKVTIHN